MGHGTLLASRLRQRILLVQSWTLRGQINCPRRTIPNRAIRPVPRHLLELSLGRLYLIPRSNSPAKGLIRSAEFRSFGYPLRPIINPAWSLDLISLSWVWFPTKYPFEVLGSQQLLSTTAALHQHSLSNLHQSHCASSPN